MPAVEEAEPEAIPQPPMLAELQALRVPTDISFHNGLAVRIGFIAAIGAVIGSTLTSAFPVPLPYLLFPVIFLASGFLAVYLYSRRTGQTPSIRSGARIGWITGIFSFTLIVVLLTVQVVVVSSQGELGKQFRSYLPPNDPRSEMLRQYLSNPAMIAGVVVFYLMLVFVILTALPTIGGALGGKVLAKE